MYAIDYREYQEGTLPQQATPGLLDMEACFPHAQRKQNPAEARFYVGGGY